MRYFLAVVDHGGVTRAATALYVAQPSLSQAIRNLESKLGVELFDRTGRGMTPSAAGRALEPVARRVLADAEEARLRVLRVAKLESGRLTVTTMSTFAIAPLAEALTELRHRYPGVQVHVRDGATPAGVLSAVRSGEAELGLLELPVQETALAVRSLGSEELVLAAPASFGKTLPSRVTAADLARLPFGVVTKDVLGTQPSAERMAPLVGEVRCRCAHRQLLWELVAAGALCTFAPRRVAEVMLPGVALRPVEPLLSREVGLIHRTADLSPAGRALIEILVASGDSG